MYENKCEIVIFLRIMIIYTHLIFIGNRWRGVEEWVVFNYVNSTEELECRWNRCVTWLLCSLAEELLVWMKLRLWPNQPSEQAIGLCLWDFVSGFASDGFLRVCGDCCSRTTNKTMASERLFPQNVHVRISDIRTIRYDIQAFKKGSHNKMRVNFVCWRFVSTVIDHMPWIYTFFLFNSWVDKRRKKMK